MEDKTIVENINPTSQAFLPPPIRRQPPVIPSTPSIGGTKNIAIHHAGIGVAAGLAVIGGTAYAIIVDDNQPKEEAALATDTPSFIPSEVSTASIPPTPIYTEPTPIIVANVPSSNIIIPTPVMPYIPVTAQPLANGIIHSEAPIATTINDDMSFNQAFVSARVEVGAGGAFEWKGKVYDTYYNEEWDAMSDEQKVQYNHSVHVDIPEDNQADVEAHEPIADPLSITPSTDHFAASVEGKSVEVDKPMAVVEPNFVSIKGNTPIDHLLIDKPDADQVEGIVMSALLPNEGAIADAVNDMNLPNDMHAEQIDNNSDGIADAILVTDSQGHIHAILVDENQNGIFEQAILDTDNNLKPDLYIVDANEDGTIDQEKLLYDTSFDSHSHFSHHDAFTIHEDDHMMNDMPDFDNHTDMVDFTS